MCGRYTIGLEAQGSPEELARYYGVEAMVRYPVSRRTNLARNNLARNNAPELLQPIAEGGA